MYVKVWKTPRKEEYELRRNPSRRGKAITREEAEELIALPGTVRVRRFLVWDSLSELYELGDPGAGKRNRVHMGNGAPEPPSKDLGTPAQKPSVSNENGGRVPA